MLNSISINSYKHAPEYKSPKSPFAVFAGERLVRMPYSSCGKQLDEMDEAIILLLNKYLVLTSILLEKSLHNLGVKSVEKKILQNHLKKLTDSEYLEAYKFEIVGSPNHSSNNVYLLGYKGAGLLKNKGIKPNLLQYVKKLDCCGVKKILSSNQFVIEGGFDLNDFDVSKTAVIEGKADKGMIFRPQAVINTGTETIFVESVRLAPKAWGYELMNKVERMCKLLKNREHANIKIQKEVSLVLVMEDTLQMKKCMELIYGNFYNLPFKVFYTCDNLVFNNVKCCLYNLKPNIFQSLFSA